MSGRLNHSPADILRSALIDLSLGSAGIPWEVHVEVEPDAPDDAIVVRNTQGRMPGSLQVNGRQVTHHGISILVRGARPDEAWDKANEIAVTLDEDLYDLDVTVEANTYRIHAFARSGDPIPIPLPPDSRRHLLTINGTLTLRQLS